MMTHRIFLSVVGIAGATMLMVAWIVARYGDVPELVLPRAAATSQSNFETTGSPTPQPAVGKVSKLVGLALQSALDALKQNPPNFDRARLSIEQAEATSGITSFERYKINEVWAYFYGRQKNYKALFASYRELIENPELKQFIPPDKASELKKRALQIAVGTGDNLTAIELANRWFEGTSDTEVLALLGQVYYNTRDFRLCRNSFLDAVKFTSPAKPNKAHLAFIQVCSSAIGDDSGSTAALESLLIYYPKIDYWKDYIRRSRSPSRIADYFWNRLGIELGIDADAFDYSHFASLSEDLSFPATGARALTSALSKTVPDEQRRIWERQFGELVTSAQSARDRIKQLVVDASQSSNGSLDFELSRIFFDNGDFANAIPSMSAALKKGQFKDPVEATLVLGIAQFKVGDRDNARKTLSIIEGDALLGAVAHAWILYINQ